MAIFKLDKEGWEKVRRETDVYRLDVDAPNLVKWACYAARDYFSAPAITHQLC